MPRTASSRPTEPFGLRTWISPHPGAAIRLPSRDQVADSPPSPTETDPAGGDGVAPHPNRHIASAAIEVTTTATTTF